MYKIILIVAIMMITGCASTSGFLNGKFPLPGDDLASSLQQMQTIAKNAAIVYDPSITDEEFDLWVAEHTFDQRRFNALLELYTMLAPADQLSAVDEYKKSMAESDAEFRRVLKQRE
jgi:hypothetical protein